MDSSLCCPWCELTFATRFVCYKHRKVKHSEEYKASLLKHSSPDELTFKRCLCCNCWTLNNSRSIENHEKSALHKSLETNNKKKRKSESFSSLKHLEPSSLPKSAAIVNRTNLPEAISHSSPAIEFEIGNLPD